MCSTDNSSDERKRLEETRETLTNNNRDLKAEYEFLKSQLDKDPCAQIKSEIGSLTVENETLNKNCEELRCRIETAQECNRLKEVLEDMKSQNADLKINFARLKSEKPVEENVEELRSQLRVDVDKVRSENDAIRNSYATLKNTRENNQNKQLEEKLTSKASTQNYEKLYVDSKTIRDQKREENQKLHDEVCTTSRKAIQEATWRTKWNDEVSLKLESYIAKKKESKQYVEMLKSEKKAARALQISLEVSCEKLLKQVGDIGRYNVENVEREIRLKTLYQENETLQTELVSVRKRTELLQLTRQRQEEEIKAMETRNDNVKREIKKCKEKTHHLNHS
ncbi:hypothetical protein WMY93_030817 [Mugilogobius chulae]|uniref:Uncharacterized protein n=1 Tax=Mugilogobius chulae TaxID=88201 RepID=A0AAW0MQ99_9GOBI